MAVSRMGLGEEGMRFQAMSHRRAADATMLLSSYDDPRFQEAEKYIAEVSLASFAAPSPVAKAGIQ